MNEFPKEIYNNKIESLHFNQFRYQLNLNARFISKYRLDSL